MNRPIQLRLQALASLLFAVPAAAQVPTDLMFSVDFQGPLMGQPAAGSGTLVSDSDILVAANGAIAPNENPRIARLGDFLSVYTLCGGHMPGVACGLEINAISGGRDARLRPSATYRFAVYLSVDEFAVGTPSTVGSPTIFSESLRDEAAADVFSRVLVGAGPFSLNPGVTVGVADGDGQRSGQGQSAFFGLGLTEPIPESPVGVDLGDNVDAIDLGPPVDPTVDPLYFSLQGGFAHCNEPQAQTFNAAAFQQVAGAPASSADVLLFDPALGFIDRYGAAQELGLDSMGFGADDIDALVVVENGVPGYQPPTAPYSWLGTAPTDLVLYSLRCGSGTIGLPDGSFNVPISQGDVLIHYIGDPLPSIFIAAEGLGLETVSRGGLFDDELDGLDVRDDTEEPFRDCNMNGVEDTDDINSNTSDDCDANGIPDECEDDWSVICDCSSAPLSPCGNPAGMGEGCMNALGMGGKLTASGTTSVTTDFLQLSVTNVNPNTFALVFMGDAISPTPIFVMTNGGRCVSPGMQGIFRVQVLPTGPSGSFTFGPGILATAGMLSPTAPMVLAGSTWGFQSYYRDPMGPCGFAGNMTNALAVPFTP